VTLSDSEGRTFYMTITTSGGLAAPQQLVFISTPSDGGVGSGSFPVSGTVDLANFGAAVGTVYAYVYDFYTNRTTYYSSSSADVTNLGYNRPLTFDTGGSFLFQATVQSTSYKAQIQVYAYDTTGTLSQESVSC
jgi:hypothetical protein